MYLQEKKGQEQMKPEEREALRHDYEYQKMEKLLSMVRQPDHSHKPKKEEKAGDTEEDIDQGSIHGPEQRHG